MGEKPIKMRLINDIKILGISPEDNDDSLESFKPGDHTGSLESSLCQQSGEWFGRRCQGTSEVGLLSQTNCLAKQAKDQHFPPQEQ